VIDKNSRFVLSSYTNNGGLKYTEKTSVVLNLCPWLYVNDVDGLSVMQERSIGFAQITPKREVWTDIK
jgi:hypothetical protein